MKMSDTCAVITGGASGLGAATAHVFLAAGAKVALLDRDAKRGRQAAADMGATFHETDVTDESSVATALADAKAEMGRITCVVNCAGIGTPGTTLGKDGPLPLATYQQVININLVGSFNVARLGAEIISENGPDEDGARGVIINTASIAAFEGQRGQVAYASSKGGIAGMTLPMARDLARNGIRVMTIAPGIFATPMLAGLPEAAQQQLAADVTCPQRLGDPAEYGRLAQFIVECGYLNGTVIRLDGALRMK
ncbi:SDR family NAD(P)-dependent oxidoreductase [Aquicoccus sp. G2-2]|uniref:SDR family NAD(P)-dependent oxidoreductase n=1 Tax=Aquicoccus sp. G2-2 TaxID=3092120 RepID=UPI002AE02509|nr:SDR family NAD(P)-dependent oxidoreductase [Aquicoccus sp. G2-2]MEA1113369.1 SDR family NAD(P)-dependent oxidoreductase [Aquicoccus sp. G2-2]